MSRVVANRHIADLQLSSFKFSFQTSNSHMHGNKNIDRYIPPTIVMKCDFSDYQVANVQMSSFSLQGTNSSSVTSGTNSSSVTSKYESRSYTIFEQIINAMEVYRSKKNMHCIPEKFYFFQQVSTPDKKNHPNLRKHGVSDRPGLGDLSDSSDTGNVQTFSRWDHLRG